MNRFFSAFLFSLVALLPLWLSGCATKPTSLRSSELALAQFHRVYVETRLNDNHAIDATIAAELRPKPPETLIARLLDQFSARKDAK